MACSESVYVPEGVGDAGADLLESGVAVDHPPTFAADRAVLRGSTFFGQPERFNRYYTDATYVARRVRYVSMSGSGDGTSRDSPIFAQQALLDAEPGDMLVFLRSQKPYEGCYTLTHGGTYDAPLVLYAERNADGSRGVEIKCSGTENKNESCLNLMSPDYVAVDGFVLAGGSYGVRGEGKGYAASSHMRGLAVLNVDGKNSYRDPIFAAQTDWTVVQNNVAHGAGKRDGHGIYLSNGGDFNLVRYNETFGNAAATFQVNADPSYVCSPGDISFTDPECDGSALEGKGRGVSEYVLVENNFFHNDDQGPNFTSVRNSIVRNNISAFHTHHNVSFWQETENPKLGTHSNVIAHNLFVNAADLHVVQFIASSTNNRVANNMFVSLTPDGHASTGGVVMAVDASVNGNRYENNFYIGGKVNGRVLSEGERAEVVFDATWFHGWATDGASGVNGFVPKTSSPFAKFGKLLADAERDYFGSPRAEPVDLGPLIAR